MTDNGSCYRSKVFRRAVWRNFRPATPSPGPTDTRMGNGPGCGLSSTTATASGPTGEIGRKTAQQRRVDLRVTNVLGIHT